MLAGIPSMGVQKSARPRVSPDSTSNDNLRPQLLNADTNPTLRFPIARMGHMNGTLSFGWLDISRSTVRYQVEQPAGKSQDSFEVPRREIRVIGFQGLFLEFSNPKYNRIFYLPQNEWESFRSGIHIVSAAEGGSEATGSIERAMENFDFALSLAKPPALAPAPTPAPPVAPPVPPASPASAPSVVLTVPAGAADNQPVLMDQSPLVIRGAAIDAGGIPVVTIGGAPANMRPQSTQAAEFWSDPLPLQPGDNRFEIIATNAAHASTQRTVLVRYTPKAAPANPRALGKQDILDLLRGEVPTAHVVELVQQRGIKFHPTADDWRDIRAAGGDDPLVEAIRQAAASAP
jgi:hypothetical protein